MTDPTERVRHYLTLEDRLAQWRKTHLSDTPEEDALLDEMDRAWGALSEKEQKEARELRRARE